jgi:hypothetical protein
VTGLLVLGLGLFGGTAAWLPAIVLLPAVAWLAEYPRKIRLALRFLVPLAILQMMHAYPVAGAQRTWGLVTMCVPCIVGVGAGLQRLAVWRSATSSMRSFAVGALCVLIAVTTSLWPVTVWHDYVKATPIDLPGARLIRVDKKVVRTLHQLTKAVQKNCDTFYSTPGFDMLYFYTKLPEPTGQLANWPGVLSVREQRDIAFDLRLIERKHGRLCVVRNAERYLSWQQSSYGKGPLGRAVAPFRRPVARVDQYIVFGYGRPLGGGRRLGGKHPFFRKHRAGS